MFDRNFPNKKVISSNILAISEVVAIQELIALSEELPKSTGSSSPPKWDNTLRSLSTRCQNDGPLDIKKEDVMEKTSSADAEMTTVVETTDSDDRPLHLEFTKKQEFCTSILPSKVVKVHGTRESSQRLLEVALTTSKYNTRNEKLLKKRSGT